MGSRGAHVAVLCVSIHVRTSSTPLIQSRVPCAVSSVARGGTDAACSVVPVVTAPSMSEPPKKQTRWSCLGIIRQVLRYWSIKRQWTSFGADILPCVSRSGRISAVYVSPSSSDFLMRCACTAVMASSYI